MSKRSFTMGAAVLALMAAGFSTPASSQKAERFGQEKVETREFRNKEVERAMSSQKPGHGHNHGKKGHKGHSH